MFLFKSPYSQFFALIIISSISSFPVSAHDELIYAIYEGDEQYVKELIDNQGFKDKIDEYSNQYDQTPLFAAAKVGNVSIVKFLLERGADINSKMTARQPFIALQSKMISMQL